MNLPRRLRPRTRADHLTVAARILANAGVEGAARDARLLMRWAAGLDGAALSARLDEEPDMEELGRFLAALAARASRRPLSQITGEREFMGRVFEVTEAVLDPRPETETLVMAALAGPAPARILDLGSGSGCILLTLLAEWPAATGLGVDASAAALEVSRRNAARLGLADRAEFREGDWLSGLSETFDLVVSNPPYIPEADIETLAPEVRDWEPRAALTPGGDGLAAYRAIAAGLAARLAPGGRAILEFGAGQQDALAAIFREAGLALRALHRDADGRPRAIELSAS